MVDQRRAETSALTYVEQITASKKDGRCQYRGCNQPFRWWVKASQMQRDGLLHVLIEGVCPVGHSRQSALVEVGVNPATGQVMGTKIITRGK